MRRQINFHFFGQWCTVVNNFNESQLNLTGKDGRELLELLVDSGLAGIAKHRIDIMVVPGLPSGKRPPVAVIAPGVAVAANVRHVQKAVELLAVAP